MSTVAELRARRSSGAQGGFALIVVLVVLLITTILVVSVLGLSFATTTFSGDQVRRDRESRAAESALEPAVGMLARAKVDNTDTNFLNGQLGDETQIVGGGFLPCNSPNYTADPTKFEFGRTPLIDSYTDAKHTMVYCSALPVERYTPETRTDSVVKLIGKLPSSSVLSTTTSPCQQYASPECMPWAEALSTAGLTAQSTAVATSFTTAAGVRNGAALLHTGPNALQVVADVDVSGGADVLRNQRTSSGFTPDPPAMTLSGRYRQGDPGPISTVSSPCGLLAANSAVPSARISADSNPNCNVATLRGDVVTKTGLVPATMRTWSPDQVRLNDVTAARLPTRPSGASIPWSTTGCPVASGQYIKFQPGAYPANVTASINSWFAACSSVKFWFPASSSVLTGYYWFDVNDAGTAASGFTDRTALRMDKGSNLYIFGTPSFGIDGTLKDSYPLCNKDLPGVHITLSPRTVIRHKAGYVAICGDRSSATRQAIWQDPTANLGFQQIVPATVVGGTTSSTWYDGLRNTFLIGSIINLLFANQLGSTFNYTANQLGNGFSATSNCSSAPCNGTVAFSTTWTPPAGQDPGKATVNSAILRLAGDTINGNDVWNGPITATGVRLYKFNSATNTISTTPCSPTQDIVSPRVNDTAGRAGPQVVDIDLFYPGSPCGTSIDRADLL
ncbi:MAG: hypothetical protein ACKOYM_00385, partial [Actinomycetes bacterium]